MCYRNKDTKWKKYPSKKIIKMKNKSKKKDRNRIVTKRTDGWTVLESKEWDVIFQDLPVWLILICSLVLLGDPPVLCPCRHHSCTFPLQTAPHCALFPPVRFIIHIRDTLLGMYMCVRYCAICTYFHLLKSIFQ